MSIKQWDFEQLYFHGDSYFTAALSAIQEAKQEVLVESYTFNLDPIGLKFIEELHRAQLRGVRIRMLIDGIGSFNWSKQLKMICAEKSLALRIYNPLPFQDQTLTYFSWRYLRRMLFLFRRINKRDHRKVIVIDQRHAFIGSCNISQVHSLKVSGATAWRDTGIEVKGDDVKELVRTFTKAWHLSLSHLKPRKFQRRQSLIRLNSNVRWRFSLLSDLKRRIHTAKERILITNAYFVPRMSVLAALRKAARRGVYVALCLPSRNTDVWITRVAARSLYYGLIKAGVEIFEYQPSFMHAKTLVIDDWMTVGSQNMNHRSLLHDLEVEAVVSHTDNKQLLIDQWDKDLSFSKKIEQKDIKQFTIFEITMAFIISLFWYWI